MNGVSLDTVALDYEAIRQKTELDLEFIRRSRDRLPARVTQVITLEEAEARQAKLHQKAGRLHRLLREERQKRDLARATAAAALVALAERTNRFLATGQDRLGLAVACGEIIRNAECSPKGKGGKTL